MPSRVRITREIEQHRDGKRGGDDNEAIGGIIKARQDLHGGEHFAGSDSVMPAGPQTSRTSSLKNNNSPNVPST